MLAGRRIEHLAVLEERLPQHVSPEALQDVVGRRVAHMRRRGKYLLFDLEPEGLMVLHLRMSGRLLWCEPGHAEPGPAHVRLRVTFEGGGRLLLVDPRRFAMLYWIPKGDESQVPGVAAMGPEPLSRAFTGRVLQHILKGRRAAVKSVLLDQRRLAGVGNIYADEALFRAGIRPDRPAASLTAAEVARLHRALRQVLQEGIRLGGVTVRSYTGIDGTAGRFQATLRVYGRRGQPCRRCGRPLEGLRIGGRSSVFCPHCQR